VRSGLAGILAVALVFGGSWPAMAQNVVTTPDMPMELPVEIEVETGPASLKQAPLWSEIEQILDNPTGVSLDPDFQAVDPNAYIANINRRGSFRFLPAPPAGSANARNLKIWNPNYNPLTAQPLRERTNDGEVSWDQVGPLHDPAQVVATSADPTKPNVPTEPRTVIGSLVADIAGNLIVSNTGNNPAIPPHGTIVATPITVVGPLEKPVTESDFFRPTTDTTGVQSRLLPYIGRRGAEVLGKALFWDMQIGSDGIQACGSCHFHAGVDNRTRGQINPDIFGPDGNAATINILAWPSAPGVVPVTGGNQTVQPAHFPFHKRHNATVIGDGTNTTVIAVSDSDDVMSSMGVSIFKTFTDIPVPGGGIGSAAFIQTAEPRALAPDIGAIVPDPVPVNQGFRRVEPRHTPTFHGAAFNFDNFWDGRARFHFNGGSVQGPSDPQFHIFVSADGLLTGLRHPLDDANRQQNLNLWANPDNNPVRIKFSSLASQAVGPPLSNFEMSFDGRNWAKIGKKMLQTGVTPLANQLVDPTDSVLGPFSGQRTLVGGAINRPGRPGLNVTYEQLIQIAFKRQLWRDTATNHLNGAPDANDPFDGYSLTVAAGAANPANTNQFRQVEANFSHFFGMAVQAYEELVIPDDTPFDRFMDANPRAANGVGQSGEQNVLYPTLVRRLVTGSDTGTLNFPDPTLFGPEELFGMDIFMGANLTAALPTGSARNPAGFGSNPFARTSRCMICHLGPEQTDHSINIAHGLLKGDAEFEFPTPQTVVDPFGQVVPAPEPPGPIKVVTPTILEEEIAGTAQDIVEVEPRNFNVLGREIPGIPFVSLQVQRIVAAPTIFAFGDQGIYNLGLRPEIEDPGRGANDAFGFALSLSTLALQNLAGQAFVPGTLMANFDPTQGPGGGLFEETGDGLVFPGTGHTLQSINPGLEKSPIIPLLPAYLAPWVNDLPAGELHPQIDELGFMVNTFTFPFGGPTMEFGEILFGADLHCGLFDPAAFGNVPPTFGWGPTVPFAGPNPCPNSQSGVTGNIALVGPPPNINPVNYTSGSLVAPLHGTWPTPNRVLRSGAFKAPSLRNVELTGPYFHTGSYLTLRQVVDFYMRGGDFPRTNANNRDPHMVSVTDQAFGFGRTTGADLLPFADALPDGLYQYDVMPDIGHPNTPEPATSSPEQAKVALVKFLISLTDQRVKFEQAPFDHPEIFVPAEGTAPENGPAAAAGGRAFLLTISTTEPFFTNPTDGPVKFRQVLAVGSAGSAAPLPNFLGISSTVVPGPFNDHFDSTPNTP
jgi:cytochrome c peroxidase